MQQSCIPRFRGVRRGDHKDAREFFDAFGAALRSVFKREGPEAARRVALEVDLEQPGLINGPAPVQTSGLINGSGSTPNFVTAPLGAQQQGNNSCPPQQQQGSAHETDQGCPPRQNCGYDSLAFRSRTVTNFPVVGNGSFAEATLTVTPRVQEIKPYAVYWTAFDANQGYAFLPVAELTNAVIGLEPQLLSPGMVASVFSDIHQRLPVTWKNVTPHLPLELTFGHPLSNMVHMHIYGVLWSEVIRR